MCGCVCHTIIFRMINTLKRLLDALLRFLPERCLIKGPSLSLLSLPLLVLTPPHRLVIEGLFHKCQHIPYTVMMWSPARESTGNIEHTAQGGAEGWGEGQRGGVGQRGEVGWGEGESRRQ